MKLEDLPDYPILKQLSKSLWGVGNTQGAAIMVGAGFSHNAELLTPLTPKPPLWWDFQNAMGEELPDVQSNDPLILAEAYEEMYGRPELDGLIRQLVRDHEWEPGELHRRLLDLPWSDALTTNWDTLLERTRENLHSQRFYDVVNVPEDIARTRAPRIVKLHGSLPSYTPFTFTSGDYEVYPEKRSPFVNLVQQVLLENDLCLVGFSGDDPNFKEWVGWVKKELGKNARRIFLLGYLNLTDEKRTQFKNDNIVPVDLAPLFKGEDAVDDPYYASNKAILSFLESAKPKPLHNWPDDALYQEIIADKVTEKPDGSHTSESFEALNNSQLAATRIREKLPLLKKLRESYPLWLVCPSRIRSKVCHVVHSAFSGLDKALDVLDEKEAGQAIYEMTWAKNVSYVPFNNCDHPLLEKAADGLLSAELANPKRLYIVQSLLRTAYEDSHEGEIYQWQQWIDNHGDDETTALMAFERCLQARDSLEYEVLLESISGVKGRDPIWKLRQAGLYGEIGKIPVAIKLIREATFELQKRLAKNRGNLWIISRLAWAALLSKAIYRNFDNKEVENKSVFETDDWSTKFKENLSDPFDELESLESNIDEKLKELQKSKQSRRAKFDPGQYDDDSERLIIKANSVSAIYQLRRMLDEVAIPLKLGHVGISSSRIQKLLYFNGWETLENCLFNIRILLFADKKVWDEHLSRVAVASIDAGFIPEIANKLQDIISFYQVQLAGQQKAKRSALGDRLKAAGELLSRFVGRLSSTKSARIFEQACGYLSGDSYQNWWHYENLSNLLRRSLLAQPSQMRAKYILDVVCLPFAIEKSEEQFSLQWPELISYLPLALVERDFDDPRWEKRVSEVIQIAAHCENLHARNQALLRLFHINQAELLSTEEQVAFTKAAWSRKEEGRLFPKSNLRTHAYLQLPVIAGVDPVQKFQVYYDFSSISQLIPNHLIAIRGAALAEKNASIPSKQQAELMLDYILGLSPKNETKHHDNWYEIDENEYLFSLMGSTLADAILPVFEPGDLSTELLNKLFSWFSRKDIPSALVIAPQLVRLDHSMAASVGGVLHRALYNRQEEVVDNVLDAIGRWAEVSDISTSLLPISLVKGVIGIVSNLRYPKLHFAIGTAKILAQKSLLDDRDVEMLYYALEGIESEADYANWDYEHAETCNLPFVRSNAVSLANTLIEKGHDGEICQRWIEIAKSDPLPEVRYTLEEGSV